MMSRAWVIGLLLLVSSSVFAVPPGYKVSSLSQPDNLAGGLIALDDGSLIAAVGGYGSMTLVKVNESALTPFASGAEDTNEDNQLDTNFSAVNDLALDRNSGVLYWTDNGTGSLSTLGEGIFRGEDLNGDGDLLDVVGGNPEVTLFYSAGDWFGAGIAVNSKGEVFASDAVGPGSGNIIQIAEDGTPIPIVTGLDYSAGIEFHPDTEVLYFGDVNASDFSGRIFRPGIDSNGNGIFELSIPDEVVQVASIPGCYDLAFDKAGNLYVTAVTEVIKIADLDRNGIPESTSSFSSGFGFATGLSFADSEKSFEPKIGRAILYVGEGSFLGPFIIYRIEPYQNKATGLFRY